MSASHHRWPVRIYYEDTDAGGVVYHARYLHFFERARTEFMRALGLEHSRLLADYGVVFTVRRVDLELAAPARLDDALEVLTRIDAMTGARLRVRQEARRDGRLLAGGDLQLAVVGTDLRPKRLPAALTDRLAAWVAAAPQPAKGA
ncbi:MAG: tol-pal system-associated acyl-CoA thioesterase [Alphaproteobacteria bacterium]|jgi:acyl-CoA thioester hydrolase|nr:tol-pal system-associated acyl-CoA thioesterase [Alphaproteobacteria bacterium]